MDERLLSEIEEIVAYRKEHFCVKNYPKIKQAYDNEYGWPELDILRHEICLCLMFGLHQAAITLSNHFLESLLKLFLTAKNFFERRDNPDQANASKGGAGFISDLGVSSTKFNNMNLYNTIQLAAKEGLIDETEEAQLQDFKEKFRNAFSHADKAKMFGDAKTRVTPIKLEDGRFEIEEPLEALIASTTIIQSIAQVQLAEETALPYFLYLDDLTRKISDSLVNDEEHE
jgi:hypothetical protein